MDILIIDTDTLITRHWHARSVTRKKDNYIIAALDYNHHFAPLLYTIPPCFPFQSPFDPSSSGKTNRSAFFLSAKPQLRASV